MNFSVQIDASSFAAAVGVKLGALQKEVQESIVNILTEGAMKIHSDAVRSIAAHGSVGKIETRYNPKRDQEVSEPGSAPNTDRGTLVQSVQFEIDEDDLKAVVGTNLLYGAYLEMGTAKMLARPWLFPAFEGNRDSIKSDLLAALSGNIAEAGK